MKLPVCEVADAGSRLPIVSVITSCLNAAATIERAIRSVSAQDYSAIEYIVVDGKSSDATVELLKKHSAVICRWISESDLGIYDAWNKALSMARGEWICFLGADDYFADDQVVSRMVNRAASDPFRRHVVYSRIRLTDTEGNALYEAGRPWPEIRSGFRQVMNLPHPGALHHRSLFERYGRFDPVYRIAGDYEFLLRHLLNHDALFVDGPPIVVMETGGGNASGQVFRTLNEVRHAQRRHGIRAIGIQWVLAYMRGAARVVASGVLGEKRLRKLVFLRRRLVQWRGGAF